MCARPRDNSNANLVKVCFWLGGEYLTSVLIFHGFLDMVSCTNQSIKYISTGELTVHCKTSLLRCATLSAHSH